jgi:hypothetical protein
MFWYALGINLFFLLIAIYLGGVFECKIVKRCSFCGKGGKVEALSRHFEYLAGEVVGERWRLGLCHRYFYCRECEERVFEPYFNGKR